MPQSEHCAGGLPESQKAKEDAFWLELYETRREQVRRYFARRVGNRHDVEDLVQIVFVNLIAHMSVREHPDAYVQVVARHVLFKYWRQRKKVVQLEHVLLGIDGEDVLPCDGDSDPLELLLRTETTYIVDSMLADLTPLLAEAMKLRFLHGLAPAEAATRAGCSQQTLKKRVTRARQFIIESQS